MLRRCVGCASPIPLTYSTERDDVVVRDLAAITPSALDPETARHELRDESGPARAWMADGRSAAPGLHGP